MPVSALLDANVLYKQLLRDLFFQLTIEGLVTARWSLEIEAETFRNLETVNPRYARTFERTSQYIHAALPETLVKNFGKVRAPSGVHRKDIHVAQAAIKSKCSFLVTHNGKDFPQAALEDLGVTVISPDAFIAGLFEQDERLVSDAIDQLRLEYTSPSISFSDFNQMIWDAGLELTVGKILNARKHLESNANTQRPQMPNESGI